MGAPSREPRDGNVTGAPARWWRAFLCVLLVAAAGAVIAVQRRDSSRAPPAQAPAGMDPSAHAVLSPDTTRPVTPGDHSEAPTTRQEVPVPFGRVVEKESGRGQQGFDVRLLYVKELLAEVTTDAGGGFRLSPGVPEGSRVEVVQRPGWKLTRSSQRLNAFQLAGSEEILFEGQRVEEAPIHGLARDSLTGEPVPRLSVEFNQGRHTEHVETDAEGRFRTATVFAAGAVMAFATDPPGLRGAERSLGQHQHLSTADGSLDLKISVGATYAFDFIPPPVLETEDFDAVLLEPDERYYLKRKNDWDRVPLRVGERPWARMRSAGQMTVGPSAPCRVELQSHDGFWRGAANVNSTAGIYPLVLHVELSAAGSYRGRVTDDAQHPLEGVSVYVSPLEAETAGVFPRVFTTEADGRFDFPWLAMGRYSIDTANDWYDPLYELAEDEISIAAGKETAGDLVMRRVESAGALSGRLLSQSGTYDFTSWQLELRSLTRPRRRLVTLVNPVHQDEQACGAFTFESVPKDEYELFIVGHERFGWEVQPTSRRVVPPAEGADFLILDQGSALDLGFLIKDEATGAAIDRFRLTWHLFDGSTERAEEQTSKRVRSIPKGRRLRWTLTVPGYEPVFGTERTFTDPFELPAEVERRLPPELTLLRNEFLLAPVQLKAGWGAKLRVSGPDSLPLTGVRVLCDGKEAGQTDGDGALVLRFASPPQKIALEHQGWIVAAGDLDTSPGSPLNLWGEVELRLRPHD